MMKTSTKRMACLVAALVALHAGAMAHDHEKAANQEQVHLMHKKVTDGLLHLETKQGCQVRIADADGHVLLRQQLTPGEHRIALPDMSKGGLHVMKISDSTGRLLKIIKLTYQQVDGSF